MARWAGIEECYLSPLRPPGPLPEVPLGVVRLVESYGPISPVVVRSGPRGYEILANVETWLAAQRTGWHEVPIDVREEIGDPEAREILALGARGEVFDPIEEARQIEAELARRCPDGRHRHGAITQLARERGRSRSYVSHALRLLKLPRGIQQQVASGRISAGHARALVTVRGARRQERLADRIVRDGLSVRAAEALARGRDRLLAPSGRPGSDDPDILRLERVLSEALGTATRIDTRAGRLVIDYGGNFSVLDGVLERLGLEVEEW